MPYGNLGNFTGGDIRIERLFDANSTELSQNPTGLGESNAHQITFGPALLTVNDPVQMLADGTFRINEAGLYRAKISLVYGRTGSSGVSELRFRALVNGTQAGVSIGTKLVNANASIPYTDDAWIQLPAGTDITYEVMRDSSGADSGGLLVPPITAATAPSWNPATCAALRVERLI